MGGFISSSMTFGPVLRTSTGEPSHVHIWAIDHKIDTLLCSTCIITLSESFDPYQSGNR
jgi:hypothetical protein